MSRTYRRQGPDSSRDRNQPYLTILLEKRHGGHQHVHAGLARHGYGRTMCAEQLLPEFWLAARAEGFELYRTDAWRHRWAEVFLEQNRGCPHCLEILRSVGREAGWAVPTSLRA